MREPAKLGVSFSYCKSIIVFKSRTSLFYCFQVWIALFFLNSLSVKFFFSHTLRPILGPVHRLQQHFSCLLVHWCSQAVSRGLCLDPLALTHSPRRGRLPRQRDLLTWQHRREQNETHRSARMRWSFLNSDNWNISFWFRKVCAFTISIMSENDLNYHYKTTPVA